MTSNSDWIDELLLQYRAEQKQGLNELAGHGTADEQLKQTILSKLQEVDRQARIDELTYVLNNIYWPIEGDRQHILERLDQLTTSDKGSE